MNQKERNIMPLLQIMETETAKEENAALAPAHVRNSPELKIHGRTTTPVFSLPTELVILIFSFCHTSPLYLQGTVSAYDATLRTQRILEEGQELAISQVCQEWRWISIGCPELWTSFNSFRAKYKPSGISERLLTYLDRAQSMTMEVWAHLTDEDDSKPLFDILASHRHSARWRQLSFIITGNNVSMNGMYKDMIISGHAEIHFPNLKAYDMYHPEGKVMLYIPTIISQMIRAPGLTSLRTDINTWRTLGVHQATLSVVQLERAFWALPMPWISFSIIASNLPHLRSLTVNQSCFQPPINPNITQQQIIAPSLQYLRCADTNVARWIWVLLRAPQLKLIVLKDMTINFSQPTDTISSYFPSLEVLAFIDCGMRETHHIRDIAMQTQNISRLIVSQDYNKRGQNALFSADNHGTLLQLPHFLEHWPSDSVSRAHVFRMEPQRDKPDHLQRNISRAARLLGRRKDILGNNWALFLDPGFARHWEENDPDLWRSIQARGLFEPVRSYYDDAFPGDTDFRWTYEAGFAAY